MCRKLQMTAAVQSIALASREASRGEARRGLRVTGSCASPRSCQSCRPPQPLFSFRSGASTRHASFLLHLPCRSAPLEIVTISPLDQLTSPQPSIRQPRRRAPAYLPGMLACMHACVSSLAAQISPSESGTGPGWAPLMAPPAAARSLQATSMIQQPRKPHVT